MLPRRLDDADLAAAKWAWDNNRPAGRDSDTLPGAKAVSADANGSWPDRDRRHRPRQARPAAHADQRRLLDALIDQGALAIERVYLVEDVDRVKRTVETDRLRSALLTSISHDLKTPLAAVLARPGTLRDLSHALTGREKADLLARSSTNPSASTASSPICST